MVMKDRDEELALFLEMRRREKEQGVSPLTGSNNSNNGTEISSATKTVSSIQFPLRRTAAENFLYSENEKSDYEWLLTPPGTPQFERESQKTLISQLEVSNARPTVLKSRLGNFQEEFVSRNSVSSKQPTTSSGLNSGAVSGLRRPSSSGGPKSGSRSSTPTARSITRSTPSTPSSSRPSTPTSRASLPSAKPTGPIRSSTPTRPTSRSSTPTARPSLAATKSVSRSATPTHRPSTTSSASKSSNRSTSVQKSVPPTTTTSTTSKVNKQVPSRGTSPTVRTGPWKPSEMPGFSLEAPPNLRTSLPGRPLSASRGRPGPPSARSASLDRDVGNEKARRQSCSPSRGRAPIGNSKGNATSIPSMRGRVKTNNKDNVSPVVIGTKSVERVVNMRRLAPPKQGENRLAGKSSSSLDSSGYGRSLSKSSLDMALRHMDFRRSVTGNLRPLGTKIPASSICSVRSMGSTKSRTVSLPDSPLATSSNASSEPSVNNNNFLCLDGCEVDYIDLESEKGCSSPRSQLG